VPRTYITAAGIGTSLLLALPQEPELNTWTFGDTQDPIVALRSLIYRKVNIFKMRKSRELPR
jgi:hypothetical protein